MSFAKEKKIPADFDFNSLAGLRLEAREKLSKIKPLTVGMASRISGVNPADITAEQWLALGEEYFSELFCSTPLKRSGLERIKQNVRRNILNK